MNSILVPTDFSEEANYALDLAVQLAKKNSEPTEVHVLHIIESPGPVSLDSLEDGYAHQEYATLIELQEKNKRSEMEALKSDPKHKGVNMITEIMIGNPYQRISKAISKVDADLVVMGTHGISGLKEILIGSNTQKLVRFAKCPVLTVKESINLNSIENIVLATNLDTDQTELITELKKLQRLTNSHISLLKVNTPNNFRTTRQTQNRLDKFVEKHQLTNCSTHVYNDATEEEGVIDFVKDTAASMIAIGTHSRKGLGHILSGSIAENLVNHSKVPVWTFSMRH